MITIQFSKTVSKEAAVKILTVTEGKKAKAGLLTPAEKKAMQAGINQSEFKGKAGTSCVILGGASKIILLGVGENPDALAYQTAGGVLAGLVKSDTSAVCEITDADMSTQVAFGLLLGAYQFDKYMTKAKSEPKQKFKQITFITPNPAAAKAAFKDKQIIAESVYLARDLCSEPANVLTPKTFADKIAGLQSDGVQVDILSLKELKAKKFGMLLSVAQGSVNEPRVAVMKWIGNPKKKTFDLGLVGKGVTFDSGGISLKPGAGMGDMKQDMTGAAVVTATVRAAALRKVKSNIIGIVGLVENMPSGTATRPGDIVTSLSGQTVEVLNTDAEGRLVLGDCLWYLQQTYKVQKIIDLATLTGATMRALGDEYAGLFANDDTLAADVTVAGETSGEKVWRMPMNDAYNKMIDSPIADMKNIGGINAGGSTAACFLGRFIQDGVTWAHLDIAGVDKEEKGRPVCPKGATGWGVRLLNELI